MRGVNMYDDKYLLDEETLDYLAEDRDKYLEKILKKYEKYAKNY